MNTRFIVVRNDNRFASYPTFFQAFNEAWQGMNFDSVKTTDEELSKAGGVELVTEGIDDQIYVDLLACLAIWQKLPEQKMKNGVPTISKEPDRYWLTQMLMKYQQKTSVPWPQTVKPVMMCLIGSREE